MSAPLPNLIVITGPTGVGKSSLAINLAKKINSEIINADSVQVYKGFDVGSGKVTIEEQSGVPHHLLSYIEASQKFDMAKFCKDAHKVILDISKRGKIPIVCGGTGMYLRALVSGMAEIPNVTEQARVELEKVEKEIVGQGHENELTLLLHEYLETIDAKAALEIDKADTQRIKRAILVFLSFSKSITDFQKEHNYSDVKYNTLFVILKQDREVLHRKINSRCKEMLELGLVKEVINLLSSYSLSCNAFNAIGYRHVVEYLRADYDIEKMLELLKRDTRRFAKRQKTWWRNQPRFLGWQSVTEEFPNINEEIVGEGNIGLNGLAQICEEYFLEKRNKISYIDIEYDRL